MFYLLASEVVEDEDVGDVGDVEEFQLVDRYMRRRKRKNKE